METDRGFRLWARRVPGVPVVAVRIWIPGGSRVEDIPGQALIAGRLLAEGTRSRSWRQLAKDAESRGCSIGATAGYSVQALALDGLAADWEPILEWAVELVRHSAFPEDRCELLGRQAAAELESLSDLPDVVAGWSFLEQLYPGHPLGRPLQGTHSGLASVSSGSSRLFHQRCMAAGPLIAVAGKIDPEAISSRLGELLTADRLTLLAEPSAKKLPQPRQRVRRVPLPEGEQAHVYIGRRTVLRADPDFDALRVLGVVLGSGDGLVGRIPQRIREEQGLAYACDLTTIAGAGVDPGRFAIAVATSKDRVDQAVAAIEEELRRVRLEGITEREVSEARSYLIGREPFRRETARQWAVVGLESLLWDVPVDDEKWCRASVSEVSLEHVLGVARRYLDPETLLVTIGTPA